MQIRRMLWLILGFIGLALGAVGAVLPMLPAFPFLLLAAFCFGKSSEKLHRWFIGLEILGFQGLWLCSVRIINKHFGRTALRCAVRPIFAIFSGYHLAFSTEIW